MEVSIIMPVYNAERFIREAIEGVLNQHFDGTFELLIADDQSTDGTATILAEYATAHPDVVKVFNNPQNLGCSANSISLAKYAKGKYLAFCDADDIWIDSLKLQKQFDFLEQHASYDMVCTDAKIVDEIGTIVRDGSAGESDVDIDFMSLICKPTDVFNSSVMMRTDFYRTMLKDCAWFEEHDCFFDSVWAWYATKNSQLRFMADPMIAFRSLRDSDSRSTDMQKAKQLERRYYMMKQAFVLTQSIETDKAVEIMLSEYDYHTELSYKTGIEEGAKQVRKSKAYRFGHAILKPFK